MRRNLVYFVCPIAQNDEWRANLRTLGRYLHVFNGRLLVTVAQGPSTTSVEQVAAELEPFGVELRVVDNDERLGETLHFLPAIDQVRSHDPEEITFYAHAKGVTPHRPRAVQSSLRRWRELMYEHCLSDIARVEAALREHACCGCFRKQGRCLPEEPADWHFSGTFFWFNHARLFGRRWSRIGASRYGVEGYLAQLFDFEDSVCLFGDDPRSYRLDRCSEADWERLLERETERSRLNAAQP